jgi:hypothetical protein
MTHLSSVVANALAALSNPAPEDPILECCDNDLAALRELLLKNTDRALELADAKLRVFPFKDVKTLHGREHCEGVPGYLQKLRLLLRWSVGRQQF